MSFSQARIDIATAVQQIKTAWSAYDLVVETDNRNNVDYATQVNPFLQVDTVYISGQQLDMADVPKIAQYGQIILSVVSKEGTGVVAANTLLDFVIPYLERKDFTCIRTKAAEPQPSKFVKGWFYQVILINFWWVR